MPKQGTIIYIYIMRTIPKSTFDWLVKEFKNREKNFITYKIYIQIIYKILYYKFIKNLYTKIYIHCITFPHNRHPNSCTYHTVTPVFAILLKNGRV